MMRRFAFLILVFALWSTSTAIADNYLWLTDYEDTVFGETVRFATGDTLDGPVRSNDCIGILGSPVFYGLFITSAPAICCGPGCDAQFLGPPPIFNAPQVYIPFLAQSIREMAMGYGQFYDQEGMEYLAQLNGMSCRLWHWEEGIPFDSTTANFDDILISDSLIGHTQYIFVDRRLSMYGTVNGKAAIGCSHDILLLDNIRYACCSGNCQDIPEGCNDYFTIASERNIVVANTTANGRDNSGGEGYDQSNPDSTSIVITAMLAAIDSLDGSLTFEQQNDPGDPYQGPFPDNRGTIYLKGGIAQRHRGYFHRSNHGGTGYKTKLKHDPRAGHVSWGIPEWTPGSITITPTELEFGEIVVGDTGFAEIRVEDFGGIAHVDSVGGLANPFFVNSIEQIPHGELFTIGFAPTSIHTYQDQIQFFLYSFWLGAPVRGTGVPLLFVDDASPLPEYFELTAYPNPFNPQTQIGFDLLVPANVNLAVYDLQGRLVETLADRYLSTGSHDFTFDGSNLTSGVYFATLQAGQQTQTAKLLLLK